MNSEKSPSFKESMGFMARGYGIVFKLTPAFLPCAALQALVMAAQPLMILFFSSKVLNELSGGREMGRIILYAALAVGLSFLLSVAGAVLTRVVERNSDDVAQGRIRGLEAEQFIRMDFRYAEDSHVTERLADMDTKMQGNGLGILNLYHRTPAALKGLFTLLFSIVLLLGMFKAQKGYTQNFATSSWAMMIVLGLFVVMLLVSFILKGKEKKMLESVFKNNANANNAAHYYDKYINAEEAAKDIRLYNQGGALTRIFAGRANVPAWHRFFDFDGWLEGVSAGMLAVIGGAVYLVIGLRALYGMYLIGDVTRYVGAVTTLAVALGELVSSLGSLYNNNSFIKPMLEFLDLPGQAAGGSRPLPLEKESGYVLEFRDVSFRYPGSDFFALERLNLTLTPNQRLAVVGLNGSGKTTMIKLLCRLYEPTEGEILLDGVSVQEYDLTEYHRLFSVVFQDFMLFPLALGENVAAGESVQKALAGESLAKAGFGQRLTHLPQGLDTYLYKTFEEDGVTVSGGEAQKIAMGRAFYKDSPIVVLDEPTAALDPIAENEVYSTFDQTIGRKTAVFISHRLSSCCFCHDIAVFENGRMVQRGNHEALLADAGGLYARLWEAQARHYVEEKASGEML